MASQLPANADIRHLKAEAKNLVKAHRAGIPAAAQRTREVLPELSDLTDDEILEGSFSLRNAQRAVARQYGFGSWNELKQHVTGKRGLADDSSLNPRLTFDTFIAGEINAFAVRAAQQAVENPGKANPLVFYGGNGFGKTHLLHAVGNETLRRRAEASVIYLPSQRFVQDMVTALQKGTMVEFMNYYRSVDALLIDDIQFFVNKPTSQENFFHVFNTLYERGHQMVFACDRFLGDVEWEERLKSRFVRGLVVELKLVDIDTRVEILMHRAEREGVQLAEDVAAHIAGLSANIFELEGAINRVVAAMNFTQQPITTESYDALAGSRLDS